MAFIIVGFIWFFHLILTIESYNNFLYLQVEVSCKKIGWDWKALAIAINKVALWECHLNLANK
jgi:hypothetical protein